MNLHPVKHNSVTNYMDFNLLWDPLQYMEQFSRGMIELQKIPFIQYQYNPRELVYEIDKVKLYHYRPKVKKPNTTPLLVVFATVNRPEILDLIPEQSFIGGLLNGGMDVYLLDWGYPDLKDKDITLSHYITEYLHQCVKFITTKTRKQKINLLGICQGGLICLCYSTLFSTIKNLVLISTPINFHTSDNTVGKFLNQVDIATYAKQFGNISGAWLTQFFISLRPFELVGRKYLRFVDNLENQKVTDKFLRVEKWLYDAPDQSGAAFTELAREFYKDNKLMKGEVSIQGKKIDLANLKMPILNVMANEDEIVPVSASVDLKKYVGSKHYSQEVFPSGHIGIYISEKVGNRMTNAIAVWLKDLE